MEWYFSNCFFFLSYKWHFQIQKLESSVDGRLKKYLKLLARTYKQHFDFTHLNGKTRFKIKSLVSELLNYLLKRLDQGFVSVTYVELNLSQQTLFCLFHIKQEEEEEATWAKSRVVGYILGLKSLVTSVSNSPDSTATLISVMFFTSSTNSPGLSAVSMYSKLHSQQQYLWIIH